jgi:hypothetical protein
MEKKGYKYTRMKKKVCVRIRTNVRREYLEKKSEIAENGEDEEDRRRRRRRSLLSSVAIYEEFCFKKKNKEKKIRKRKKTVYSYLFLVFYSYFFP